MRVVDSFPKYKRYLVFKRFLEKVKVGNVNECWPWTGSVLKNSGYGQFWWPEKKVCTAHVAAYELFVGKRHGLCVCHSCDNPVCVNPSHLWLGTHRQNTQDMFTKGRQHNRRGPNSGTAKLEWEDVNQIRKLYATGRFTQGRLASRFKVHQSTIQAVVSEKSYVGKETIQ